MRTVAATNNSSEYRNAGDIRQMLFRAQLAAAGLMVCTILGCQSQPKQAGNPASTVAKSVVAVQTAAEALTVHTPEAEFVLTADGALTATLHKQGTNLTLDKKLIDNGQCVTIGGKEYPRTALDLSAAAVKNVSGKLGSLGKQIEVTGTIPGTDMQETLTLEVYDSFPNLALLSFQLRNNGQKEIALDSVLKDSASSSHREIPVAVALSRKRVAR